MCGADKQLCMLPQRNLEDKSLHVSFMAISAPTGHLSSEVVCAGGLPGRSSVSLLGPCLLPLTYPWSIWNVLRTSSLAIIVNQEHFPLRGWPYGGLLQGLSFFLSKPKTRPLSLYSFCVWFVLTPLFRSMSYGKGTLAPLSR